MPAPDPTDDGPEFRELTPAREQEMREQLWEWSAIRELFAEIGRLRGDRDRLAAEVGRLQAFKDWVHNYLDQHGVPHHPPGTHGAEGCRIGDRMDWVLKRAALAPAPAAGVGE